MKLRSAFGVVLHGFRHDGRIIAPFGVMFSHPGIYHLLVSYTNEGSDGLQGRGEDAVSDDKKSTWRTRNLVRTSSDIYNVAIFVLHRNPRSVVTATS